MVLPVGGVVTWSGRASEGTRRGSPLAVAGGRNPVRAAECALVSILAHLAIAWMVLGASQGGRRIPTDEREARVFFLLPPDRVADRPHQTEIFQWGRIGGDPLDGRHLEAPDEGWRLRPRTYGARPAGEASGARAQVPFGPPATLRLDSVFSVLEVDASVERHPGSAAPAYPPDLLAIGTEGLVEASYVVDPTGSVDTTTIRVLHSDDPRFTESVRTALAHMRFRPASRGGRAVRQLVEQRFRFRIAPPAVGAGGAPS